jgi:hypothetical protein
VVKKNTVILFPNAIEITTKDQKVGHKLTYFDQIAVVFHFISVQRQSVPGWQMSVFVFEYLQEIMMAMIKDKDNDGDEVSSNRELLGNCDAGIREGAARSGSDGSRESGVPNRRH